jgi:GAF domain-containing protein
LEVVVHPLPDLAEALAAAARRMGGERTVDETLSTIAHTARRSIPGFDHVGISTIDRGGVVTTRAATDDLVTRLDDLQYGLEEGPCLQALRTDPVVVVPDLRHEQRWPRYVARAARAGLKAQLAVQLFLDDEGTLGGLNLYSTSSAEIHPDAEAVADLFASHAAIALGHARKVSHLNQALTSRKVIGQALGILMERYGLTDERAFEFLVRASSHGNVKLRDVAQDLVDKANQR